MRSLEGDALLDHLAMLSRFGLTNQEAKIYWTLLSGKDLTGYEAAKLTGVSRSNAYSALAGLVEKGAACLVEGAATRYTPVPPQEFCGGIIRELEDYREALTRGQPLKKREPAGYITVTGEKQIYRKIRAMLESVQERVYCSMSREILEQFLPELTELTEKGRKVVVITEAPFALAGAILYHAENRRGQIRLIADSASVLTGDVSDGEASTCLFSQKSNLVDLFKETLKNEITLIELTRSQNKKD